MNLYLIVWDYKDDNMESDWLHVVSDKYPDSVKERELVEKRLIEVHEIDEDDLEVGATYELDNIWTSLVSSVNGYKIKVEKE